MILIWQIEVFMDVGGLFTVNIGAMVIYIQRTLSCILCKLLGILCLKSCTRRHDERDM